MEEMKKCSKCERELPKNKYYFFKKGNTKDGFDNRCKECCGKKFTVPDIVASEGNCICKKCKRELPWTPNYFPKIKSEKNLRQICRECNPKYGRFIEGEYVDRIYWTEEETELFKNRYPIYTNQELIEKFYSNLNEKQLTNKAWDLGVSKNEEAYWRGRQQQSVKISEIAKGRVVSEETKRKLSIKRKQQYADGTWIPSWKGRVPTKEERERLSKRVKGLWAGDKNSRCQNPLKGENNPNWNGGITYIYVALRENISDWKKSSMELCGYKCILSGTKFHDIHHLYPFNKIVSDSLEQLNLELKPSLGEYAEEERESLIVKVKENHYKSGLGVCLSKDLHKLFHAKYTYANFKREDFNEFIENYFNGIYDNELEDDLKSINIKNKFRGS